ncbi:MAG: RNA polymerase I enhancer binding protein [Claussenomyces sp. TS43310]|nr:MAG: RNA polymerase I enhancer binding protein [Claussenomyces sp. TS43310]
MDEVPDLDEGEGYAGYIGAHSTHGDDSVENSSSHSTHGDDSVKNSSSHSTHGDDSVENSSSHSTHGDDSVEYSDIGGHPTDVEDSVENLDISAHASDTEDSAGKIRVGHPTSGCIYPSISDYDYAGNIPASHRASEYVHHPTSENDNAEATDSADARTTETSKKRSSRKRRTNRALKLPDPDLTTAVGQDVDDIPSKTRSTLVAAASPPELVSNSRGEWERTTMNGISDADSMDRQSRATPSLGKQVADVNAPVQGDLDPHGRQDFQQDRVQNATKSLKRPSERFRKRRQKISGYELDAAAVSSAEIPPPTPQSSARILVTESEGSQDGHANLISEGIEKLNDEESQFIANSYEETYEEVAAVRSSSGLSEEAPFLAETHSRSRPSSPFEADTLIALPGIASPNSERQCPKKSRRRAILRAQVPITPSRSNETVHDTNSISSSAASPSPAARRSPHKLKHKRRMPLDNQVDPGVTEPPKQKRSRQSITLSKSPKSTSRVAPTNSDSSSRRPKSSSTVVGAFTEGEMNVIKVEMQKFREMHDMSEHEQNELIADVSSSSKELWSQICLALPQRDRLAIQKHCRRNYHNYSARGKWTAEDDQNLLQAQERHSNRWSLIGKLMDRHPEDVRDRWRNKLFYGDKLTMGYWTQEEEKALKIVVRKGIDAITKLRENALAKDPTSTQYDGPSINYVDWHAVSKMLQHRRGRSQCLLKWKQIQRKQEL